MMWESYPIIWLFLLVLSICSGCIFIHSYLIKITLKRNKLFQTKYQKSFQVLFCFLIYLFGFWGTFSQYMLLWSDAFFSRSSFVSSLALNPVLYFYDTKTFKEADFEIEKVKELTKGKGAEAVIDFVGEKGSTPMGIKMTKATGTFYIVGYGEEIRVLAIDMIDQEKSIVGSLVGTWAELYELMELADKGLVKLSMKEYKLEEANKALHDLNDGKIKGRAVLVP